MVREYSHNLIVSITDMYPCMWAIGRQFIITLHPQLLQDHREELEESLGYKVRSFLSAPVCNKVTGRVVAICCMINKTTEDRYDILTGLHRCCFSQLLTTKIWLLCECEWNVFNIIDTNNLTNMSPSCQNVSLTHLYLYVLWKVQRWRYGFNITLLQVYHHSSA